MHLQLLGLQVLFKNNYKHIIMNMPQIPSPENFITVSRKVWEEMRRGTVYDQGTPKCGDFVNDFYGLKNREAINLNELVKYIKQQRSDHTLWFDWSRYISKQTEKSTGFKDDIYIDKFGPAPEDIPFEYINKEGKKVQSKLSALLNKRKCYLEDDLNKQWAININIQPEKEVFGLELNFFYQDTFKFRKYGNNSFESNSKYVAICLQSSNLLDFMQLVRFLLDEGKSTTVSNAVESSIARTYAHAIHAAKDGFELNFLYENAPEFVLASLSQYIDNDTFFAHLLQLKARDESKWFKDTSGAIINVLKSIGDAKFIYEKFRNSQQLLKEFFYNLDGESPIDSQMMPNKLVFASFMTGLCRYNGFKGFDMAKLPTFTIGYGYYVVSERDPDDDPIASKYSLEQKGTDMHVIVPGIELTIDEEKEMQPSGNYEPFEPVLFVDATAQDRTPMLVPAMYIKALAHLQQVKDMQHNIRIGADILGIVLGILSLGAASPLLAVLGGVDILLTSGDLGVALYEDTLMQTDEGKAFLATWNKIALVGGVITAGPLLARSAFNLGAKLMSKVTLAGTRNFLMACLTKMVLEMNIARFAKNTLKVVEFKDIFLSFPYLTYAKQLFEVGVIFVEGELVAGKRAFGALYKGELIAVGTTEELVKQFNDFWKLGSDKLIAALEGISSFKTLLKNERFAQVYTTVSKLKKLPLAKWLTVEDVAVIRYYTTSAYEELNRALRGLAPMTEELQAFENLLNKALDKLPISVYNKNSILYRVTKLSEKEISEIFPQGKTITEKGFTSATYHHEAMESWFKDNPLSNVLIRIEGKNGRLVEDLSFISEENEILFKSATQFDVVSVGPGRNPIDNLKQITIIILKER